LARRVRWPACPCSPLGAFHPSSLLLRLARLHVDPTLPHPSVFIVCSRPAPPCCSHPHGVHACARAGLRPTARARSPHAASSRRWSRRELGDRLDLGVTPRPASLYASLEDGTGLEYGMGLEDEVDAWDLRSRGWDQFRQWARHGCFCCQPEALPIVFQHCPMPNPTLSPHAQPPDHPTAHRPRRTTPAQAARRRRRGAAGRMLLDAGCPSPTQPQPLLPHVQPFNRPTSQPHAQAARRRHRGAAGRGVQPHGRGRRPGPIRPVLQVRSEGRVAMCRAWHGQGPWHLAGRSP
jgi:hypothetical protein